MLRDATMAKIAILMWKHDYLSMMLSDLGVVFSPIKLNDNHAIGDMFTNVYRHNLQYMLA